MAAPISPPRIAERHRHFRGVESNRSSLAGTFAPSAAGASGRRSPGLKTLGSFGNHAQRGFEPPLVPDPAPVPPAEPPGPVELPPEVPLPDPDLPDPPVPEPVDPELPPPVVDPELPVPPPVVPEAEPVPDAPVVPESPAAWLEPDPVVPAEPLPAPVVPLLVPDVSFAPLSLLQPTIAMGAAAISAASVGRSHCFRLMRSPFPVLDANDRRPHDPCGSASHQQASRAPWVP
ncbi:MAG: hypothetical protein JWN86_2151 [Planctomycetota bacterium]|nr:hypothetical protein [Planctomycetota bacterium]